MPAVLITSSLAGAMQFARQMGWRQGAEFGSFLDSYGAVVAIMDTYALLQISRSAVVHVGYFDRDRSGQATKRHLLRQADLRGHHIIHYDLTGARPELLRPCQVCGADRPCLRTEDLLPEEPGIPCTFGQDIDDLDKRLRITEKCSVELDQRIAQIAESTFHLCQHIKQIHERIDQIESAIKIYRRPVVDEGVSDGAGRSEKNIFRIPERPRRQ